jgi:hypothetical protein
MGDGNSPVKERVGHGKYTVFVTDRLRWNIKTAERFAQVHTLFQNRKIVDFQGITIDA